MQTINVTTKRDLWKNWTASSRVPLNDGSNRVLRIDTRKDSRGDLTTTASVVVFKDEGMFTSESFTPFEDYCEQVRTTRGKRCTEKAVREQQVWAVAHVDNLMVEVRRFYAFKAAA